MMFRGLIAVGATFLILTLVFSASPVAKAYPGEFVNLGPICINGYIVDMNGGAYPGAHVISISWNWGDGTTTVGDFPEGHVYGSSGTYTVEVTVFFDDSTTVATSAKVTVPTTGPTGCLTLTIVSGLGGSVSYESDVGNGVVGPGESATLYVANGANLVATPQSGYVFSSWSVGGGLGCVTVTSSATGTCGAGTITAIFSPIGQVPEFPLGMVTLLALALPALLLLKSRLRMVPDVGS